MGQCGGGSLRKTCFGHFHFLTNAGSKEYGGGEEERVDVIYSFGE
jgi:hypothetical protein